MPNPRNALVTGASSGIGQAIAERLAAAGNHVIVHFNRNAEGAERTLTAIREKGGSAEVASFDVQDRAAVERALDPLFKTRSIDILVNNAGLHKDNLAGMMSDEEFDAVIRTNLYGPFYLMRWVVRKMIRQRAGAIVNVASISGQIGNAGQINYAASKAGLIAMTKTLATEVGSRGIRVNAVSPGLIETEMLAAVPGLEDLKQRIPLRRLGLPHEVAGAVAFLCSDDAAYITGQTLGVNGGLLPS